MWDLDYYKTESGNNLIHDYLNRLNKKHKVADIAAIRLYLKRLCEYGYKVNEVYPGTTKYLGDGIYELRPTTTRIFFFYFEKDTIVLLHAIEKKRMDIPKGEIKKALQEKQEYERTMKHGNN